MLVPNRNSSSDSYRYGFQGQEKDDEIKGEGNSLNYTFRMHDPRVGRFFATDPLEAKYPWYTPYQFGGNSPILSIELEGLEESTTLNTNQIPSRDAGLNSGGIGPQMEHEIEEVVVNYNIQKKPVDTQEFKIINEVAKSVKNAVKSISSFSLPDVFGDFDPLGFVLLGGLSQKDVDKLYSNCPNYDGRYSPSTDPTIPLLICAAPFVVEYGAAYGISLFEMPTWGTFGAKAGIDFTTELIANKGNIGNVNAVSVIGAGFGADALSSPFSLTWNYGFVVNSFGQSVVNYGTNKFNGKLKSGVNYLNNRPLFQNGFSKVYFKSVIIGTESFTKNTTNDLFPNE